MVGGRLKYARSKNLTPYDVLIIASMIEKEVQVPRERALVGAVIYNRLREGMPLGIDATIRYGYDIPPTQAILQSQLEADHPYNTRKRVGPPADADLEPRARVAPGGSPPGRGRLPLLRPQARTARATSSRRAWPSSTNTAARGPGVRGLRAARRRSSGCSAIRSGTRSRPDAERRVRRGRARLGVRCARGRAERLEEAVAGLVAPGFAAPT